MTNKRIIQIDSVDAYNKLYGWETLHPLVTVANHPNPMASDLNHSRLNYGLYALFLKQGDGHHLSASHPGCRHRSVEAASA